MLVSVSPQQKEFHTRSQRKHFKEMLSHVAGVEPSVVDLIYKELAMDASIADNPETQKRIRLIFLGEKEWIKKKKKKVKVSLTWDILT